MPWYQRLWESLSGFFYENWQRILIFALVLVVGFIVVKIIIAFSGKVMKKSKLNNAAGDFLLSVIKALLYIVYIIALLSLLGVPTTSLVALLSVFALAISLAMQNTISNLASGVVIIATKPFEEGDYVDIGDNSGSVQHISIFSTRLVTPDNKIIVIPNSTVASSDIVNYSTQPTRRLDLTLSVSYGTDVEKVKSVVSEVIARHEEIFTDPAPMIRLAEHGANSLNFTLRVWVKNSDYWNVNFDLKEEILKAFESADIEIPFNQLDVHVLKSE
jgi:hypothetical protein